MPRAPALSRGLDRRALLTTAVAAIAAAVRPSPASAHGGRHEPEPSGPRLSVKTVTLGAPPDIAVVSMRGRSGQLAGALDVPTTTILNFVFTTCSTTCSMQTAVLAEVQRRAAAKGQPLSLVSLTIDPDNDTPERMLKFASSFGVLPGWQFLTGRFDDLVRVQRHFDVYRGSKVAHPPVLMMRRSARAPWVRAEGYPTPDDVSALIQRLPPEA
jgi:protein SCO1/2